MKMIASTKLAKAQRAMQNGKQYGIANSGVFGACYEVRHVYVKSCGRDLSKHHSGVGSEAHAVPGRFFRQGSLRRHSFVCDEGNPSRHR